ncbi:MAG TPA: tetratricopeptide repeat protein [Woeseiaceae bacterium]|nr:tetratricopeptide repeat protein [Woeseiaceae bacterium]
MIARCSIRAAVCKLLVTLAVAAQPAAAETLGGAVTIEDAPFGDVLFYFYQEKYFPAIVRLLAARERHRLEHHDAEAELLLGGLYLSYGHHLKAAEIFERLLAGNAEPAVRDRTWFFLAKIRYERGYPNEAEQALASIRDALPAPLEAERRMLQAQLLIGRNRFDEAIALLEHWEGAPEWASYARFNLAVALARSGRVEASAAVLDELGQAPGRGEELAALKDKANLALGYTLLRDGRAVSARMPLKRVRLSGPFSNKALLGVGWADAELGAFDRALVPWLELAGRNLLDPAVQESLLAVPYAMAKMDAAAEAADRYLQAIQSFRRESERIDRTIERIAGGSLIQDFLAEDPREATGWYWKLDELPDGVEARHLYQLLATHEFQEGLKNYRDLEFLARNLNEWRGSVGVFRRMLDTRELGYRERLPRTDAALTRADIDRLIDRKLELDARLNGIEAEKDTLALATDDEFRQWGEIAVLERSPVLARDIPAAAEARDRIRLLKGVLQWRLEKEFKSRLWNLRRSLRAAGEGLVETQRARRSIDHAMQQEPRVHADFERRVAALSPRVDTLLERVNRALSRQRAFLQAIAIDELENQKSRLDTYTVQARFALAAIYDRSSSVEDRSP